MQNKKNTSAGLPFAGFPDSSRFFFDLSFSNTVENKAENAESFKKIVWEPMNRLYEQILPLVESFDTDMETRQRRCVGSPYPDMRYARIPIREFGVLRFTSGRETIAPTLSFWLDRDGGSIGFFFRRAENKDMAVIREILSEAPEVFEPILQVTSEKGFAPAGEPYKKDHYPDVKLPLVHDLLNRKFFYYHRPYPPDGIVNTPAIAEEVADGFRTLLPLYTAFSERLSFTEQERSIYLG